MRVKESAENYLETIYILGKNGSKVRSVDIATELDFAKPSVSIAMRNLRENGFINVSENGHITLTESGLEIAETMYERHTFLSNWLIELGVKKEIAVEDACRIEHVISFESFEAVKQYVLEEQKKNN